MALHDLIVTYGGMGDQRTGIAAPDRCSANAVLGAGKRTATLQGAHAWRSIAAGVSDPTVSAELARCSELEEISSAMVLQVLAKFDATPSTAGCLI